MSVSEKSASETRKGGRKATCKCGTCPKCKARIGMQQLRKDRKLQGDPDLVFLDRLVKSAEEDLKRKNSA